MGSDLDNGLGAAPPPEESGAWQRLRRAVIGQPRDLGDTSLHRRLTLVALLAWVGLGADGRLQAYLDAAPGRQMRPEDLVAGGQGSGGGGQGARAT